MKLSAYTRQIGVSYRTAWRWFKAGKLTGFQADTGTIILTDPTPEKAHVVALCKVAIYTRVSAAENKVNLEGQAKRLQDYCAAKGYQVSTVVKDAEGGLRRE
jgi:predicted site-specific integrase-resolvase